MYLFRFFCCTLIAQQRLGLRRENGLSEGCMGVQLHWLQPHVPNAMSWFAGVARVGTG